MPENYAVTNNIFPPELIVTEQVTLQQVDSSDELLSDLNVWINQLAELEKRYSTEKSRLRDGIVLRRQRIAAGRSGGMSIDETRISPIPRAEAPIDVEIAVTDALADVISVGIGPAPDLD